MAHGDDDLFEPDEAAALPDTLITNSLFSVGAGPAEQQASLQQGPNLGQKVLRSKIPQAAGGLAGALAASPLIPEFAAMGTAVGGPIGAAVGGAVPPVAGALLGGAGLEAWRQNIARLVGEHAPETSIDALNSIGDAGLDQAVQEATGRMFLGTAHAGAKTLLGTALKTTPDIAQTAIREGIAATKAGLNKLNQRWTAITGAERKIAMRAGFSGVRISAAQIANDAADAVRSQIRGADRTEFRELYRRYQRYLKRGDMSPSEVLSSRKWSDRMANGLYKSREGGKRGVAGVRELWHEAVGNSTRQHLQNAVPEIANPDTYKRLVGTPTLPSEIVRLKGVVEPIVKRSSTVARKVIERGGPAAAGAAIGATVAPGDRFHGALTGAAIGAGTGYTFTPQTLSRVGHHVARNPVLTHLLLNLPRIVSTFSEAPAESTNQ